MIILKVLGVLTLLVIGLVLGLLLALNGFIEIISKNKANIFGEKK